MNIVFSVIFTAGMVGMTFVAIRIMQYISASFVSIYMMIQDLQTRVKALEGDDEVEPTKDY